jgi:hypothetical protein
MDIITIGPAPIARYWSMTVGTTPIGILTERLTGGDGKQMTRAIGRVQTNSVMVGYRDLIGPTTTIGMLLAANDVIEIRGHENLTRVRFYQASGGATIQWMLFAE